MPLLVSPGSTFLRNHLPGNPQVRLCFWDLYPHERAMLPDHRLTNCLLWAKFGPPPVSKVLLESSHTYSFMYYLWLLYGRMAELSSFDMHCLSCKATDVYYLVQWQNKFDDCYAGQCFEHIKLCLRDFACAVPSAWSSHSLTQWMINCFSVVGPSKKVSSSETSSLPTHLRQTSASLVHCPVFSELMALTWWPLFIGCCSFHHYQLARELMRGRNLSVLLISGSQYALKNICKLRDEDEWKILQWACTHTNWLQKSGALWRWCWVIWSFLPKWWEHISYSSCISA